MTALFLGLCALACPLMMLLMMWFMRRNKPPNRGDE